MYKIVVGYASTIGLHGPYISASTPGAGFVEAINEAERAQVRIQHRVLLGILRRQKHRRVLDGHGARCAGSGVRWRGLTESG